MDKEEVNLSALEDGEEVKLEPEETIPKRAELNLWKSKNEGTELIILTPNNY